VKETVFNDHIMRQGGWQKRPSRAWPERPGLLGLGIIGRQVARIGRAMFMRVLAWSPHLTSERASAHGAEYVPFKQIFTTQIWSRFMHLSCLKTVI